MEANADQIAEDIADAVKDATEELKAEIARLTAEAEGLRHIAKGNKLAAEAQAMLCKDAEAEVERLRNIMRSVLEVDQSVGTRSTVHDIAWSALPRKEEDE